MNHIIMGAALPFIVAVVVYLIRGRKATLPFLFLTTVWMVMCASWALVPDWPRLFGNLELYSRLSHDPSCDIFFWHFSIDRVEVDSPLYGIGFVIIAISLLTAAWKELDRDEKVIYRG